MQGLPDFNPVDRKFWIDKPEVGFNPDKNKRIINETIKKYEANRRKKMMAFKDGLAERTDAVATYLTGRYGLHKATPAERYFGKRYLAYLRGENIVENIRRVKTDQQSSLGQKVWNGQGYYLGGNKSGEKS